ncbi:MAG: AAA family ATPase, partial [Chloroflexales bacterium]|nr:AAA family ATPase [Chloroflexales bacterium]
LAGARYAISTYLPRLLLAHQLSAQDDGPWLEWVEGALLFADVSGSTALAERLTALGREGTEVVTETLNSYFGTMIRLIEQAGGDLLTFGGDALLVLFDGTDPARAATATALSLLRELAGFVREVPGIGSFPLTMHIGVEAGPVALVSAGHPQALRYSAMGNAVRDVARAEGYGGKGELVLGPRAWAAVAADARGGAVPHGPGFMHVWALGGAAPPAPAPSVETRPPALTLEALDDLARQVDRISPYLPADLLARILADPNRPRVEADLRPVTVLFAQVAGLGAMIEGRPPAEAAAAVDALLRPLQTAVSRFGGFVNKLDLAEEGDKLMAVFGAPVAHEDHAESAARAALWMERALRESPAHQGLRLRIGLNTGNVFAGNVGTAERKEYTVMGDAVNVAARVMAAAAWGEIRCTQATAALVGDALACVDPRRVTVKGKSEPLELLHLTGEREGPAAPAPPRPLIGRAGELAWLRGHLGGAAEGRGRTVRVQGEAGIGKSHLAAALLDEATAAGARVVAVRCLAYNSTTPYAPWGEALRQLCGVSPGDDQPTRAGKLAAALEAAGVPADDWLPLMADLARLDVEPNTIVRALDPGQRQARRFEIFLAVLRSAAHDQGPEANDASPASLVLLFDNLQWADQVSLDLWQYVARHCGAAPILLLGMHRGALE